jgi:hypothetical protein
MRKLYFTLLALIFTAAAHAQVVYTSRTTYDLAHANNVVIDFNNFGPAGTFYPTGLTASSPGGDITFTGTPQTPTSIEVLASTSFGISGIGNFVLNDNGGQFLADSLLITLPVNTFSFGTDIISPSQTVPEPYTFTIYSGSTVIGTLTPVSAYGSYTFTGFDSLSSPITSIAVQIANALGNPEPVLDNFTVVPEPSTWLAAVLALGVIGFSQRKRMRACASSGGRKNS